eukprot:TRINITY_DN1786_c0_g1_i4.p1 TRINITY_DN1786_c0_g1~~TRINITY_DN1786_c0_g1_i4.p1  ORF type:complete len:276 (-),score=38.44 TRINITY_DN1786_c0_g1_i4:19-846(-)
MPLVIVCGFPCSGKTTRAQKIVEYFVEQNRFQHVHLLNEETLHIDRAEAYQDSINERRARNTLKSAVERYLSHESLVICDSLNYIKGFRYELFCRARASHTPHCVVYCNTSVDICREWNNVREENKYLSQHFEDLVLRMEVPNANVKWDKPLFVLEEKDDLPLQEIHDALVLAKAAKASLATTPQTLSDTNFLFELDRITMDMEKAIIAAQQQEIGSLVALPHTKNKLMLGRKTSVPELRRLRLQYIHIAKLNPPQGNVEQIANVFLQYLKQHIE